MKSFAFPGVEGKGDPISPDESNQRALARSGDPHFDDESNLQERGSVAAIAETENNAGNSENYVLSGPSTYPTYPKFSNPLSAAEAVRSIKIIPQQLVTPEILKQTASAARAAVQAAREARPNEDASYFIPQLSRLRNVSSASVSESQRIENEVAIIMEEVSERVATSLQQSQEEVQNSTESAERAAAKLERVALNLGANSRPQVDRSVNRTIVQSMQREAADATEAVRSAA